MAIAEPEYVKATVSRERVNTIERAASAFFTTHCCQETEGDFAVLIAGIRNLAGRRNDIAHGVVTLVWSSGKEDAETASEALNRGLLREEYMLVPATYMDKKFDGSRTPTYMFNASVIRRYAKAFDDYRWKTEALLIRVERMRKKAPHRRDEPH
jgi:hypothetical protein